MDAQETKKRALAAHKLLTEETTTREKFESIRTLIKGLSPQLDNLLNSCSKTLSEFEKLKKGELIEFTVEHLPEGTEEEKKRKKKLLAFIKTWKELESEVKRVKEEFENIKEQKSRGEQTEGLARIMIKAKGPLGIITVGAMIVAGVLFFTKTNGNPAPQETAKIKVIIVNGQKILLSEVKIGSGPECDGEHYHALDPNGAKSLAGNIMTDPGGCGYGKVKEVSVMEVEKD